MKALSEQLLSVKAYALLMGGATASSRLYERDGITASVVTAAPAQAMANVVTYMDPDRLLPGLVGLERHYAAAGVSAWQLWDWAGTEAAELEAAGYKPLGHMPGMTIELENLAPVRLGGFKYTEHDDLEVVGRVNEATYENGAGLAAALSAKPAALPIHVYETLWEGETGAAIVMVYPPDSKDVTAFFLATHPKAAGHGLGQKLYVTALRDAHARGYTTASLQASAIGAPLYRRLGFEPVGKEVFSVYERNLSESA